MVALSPLGGAGWQFFDDNGVPLAGGWLYTYVAGTTTPQTTYTSNTGGTPNANPIPLDASGRIATQVWLTEATSYKFVLKTSTGALVDTEDNVVGITASGDVATAVAGIYSTFASSAGSSLLGFIQAGTGAVATTVQDELRRETWAEQYGATGDGSTDDAAAIQKAINAVSALGGGYVRFRAKTYIIGSTLTLPSKVILWGAGSNATAIKLKNSTNVDMLKTTNFDTLTGTDKWLTSDGVPYAFGFKGIRFDGNKANNTTGYGAKVYGKDYRTEDFLVVNTPQVGFFSECGASGGQTDYTDMPEGKIDIAVKTCGGHGIQYRGPHDGYFDRIIAVESGGDNARFEQGATYNGAADINFAHIYSAAGDGLYVGAKLKGNLIISESNYGRGIVVDGADKVEFANVELYSNNRNTTSNIRVLVTTDVTGSFTVGETVTGGTSGATGVISTITTATAGSVSYTTLKLTSAATTFTLAETITGGTSGATAKYAYNGGVAFDTNSAYTQVGVLRVRDTYAGGALNIMGNSCQFSNVEISGESTAQAIGVRVAANGVKVVGEIHGYNGTGGQGIMTNAGINAGTSRSRCTINVDLNDCKTLWNHVIAGRRENFVMRGFSSAGQANFTGVGPGTTFDNSWDAQFSGTSTQTSRVKGSVTILNGTTSIVFTHNALATPTISDFTLSPQTDMGSAGAANTAYIDATTITATQVTVKSSAAAGVGGLKFTVNMNLGV